MIAKNIENLCKKQGISLHALEKALGFSNSTIAKWNVSSPSVVRLAAVADYFGVTVDELLKDSVTN